jgi:hypothetical protein
VSKLITLLSEELLAYKQSPLGHENSKSIARKIVKIYKAMRVMEQA